MHLACSLTTRSHFKDNPKDASSKLKCNVQGTPALVQLPLTAL